MFSSIMRNYQAYKFDDLLEQDMWITMEMSHLLKEEFNELNKSIKK